MWVGRLAAVCLRHRREECWRIPSASYDCRKGISNSLARLKHGGKFGFDYPQSFVRLSGIDILSGGRVSYLEHQPLAARQSGLNASKRPVIIDIRKQSPNASFRGSFAAFGGLAHDDCEQYRIMP